MTKLFFLAAITPVFRSFRNLKKYFLLSLLKTLVLINIFLWKLWYISSGFFDESPAGQHLQDATLHLTSRPILK